VLLRLGKIFLIAAFSAWLQYLKSCYAICQGSVAGCSLLRRISNRSILSTIFFWRRFVLVRLQQNRFVNISYHRVNFCLSARVLYRWRNYVFQRICWAVSAYKAIERARRRVASVAFLAWKSIFLVLAAQMVCVCRLAGATRRHCAGVLLRFHRAWALLGVLQRRRRCQAVAGLMRTLQRAVFSVFRAWKQYAAAGREEWIAGTIDLAAAAAVCIDAAVAGIRDGIYQVCSCSAVCNM
jgi:hypothetical protein